MEYTFVADYDFECPKCYGQLLENENDDERKCKDCGNVVRVFTTKEGE